MISKRAGAVLEIRDRLSSITVAGGFATDAGKTIFLGQAPLLGPDDPTTAIAIVLGDSEEVHRGESDTIDSSLVVSLQAFAKAAPSAGADPYLMAESIVADIKRAVELEDRSLGGWCLPLGFARLSVREARRLDGTEYVAASADYTLDFEDAWGHP